MGVQEKNTSFWIKKLKNLFDPDGYLKRSLNNPYKYKAEPDMIIMGSAVISASESLIISKESSSWFQSNYQPVHCKSIYRRVYHLRSMLPYSDPLAVFR